MIPLFWIYIPGWEVDIAARCFLLMNHGLVVDYLAEILRKPRKTDYASCYQPYFQLSYDISTHDRDSIQKIFSDLMKLLFPLNLQVFI